MAASMGVAVNGKIVLVVLGRAQWDDIELWDSHGQRDGHGQRDDHGQREVHGQRGGHGHGRAYTRATPG